MSRRPTLPEVALYSEVLSLRRWLYEVNGGPDTDPPGLPILMKRDASVSRPFWRLDITGQSTLRRVASGWEDGNRPYTLVYGGTDPKEVGFALSRIRDLVMRYARFPFSFFDGAWFRPLVEVIDDPDPLDPILPVGEYTVSCSVLNHDDEETLASDPVTFTLSAPRAVRVRVPVWPWQAPLAAKCRVYVGVGAEPRRAAVTVPQTIPAVGWEPVVLSLPSGVEPLEPTSSVVYAGSVSVDFAQVNIYDSPDNDDEFDGVLLLSTSRPLWTHENLEGTEGYRPYEATDISVSLSFN